MNNSKFEVCRLSIRALNAKEKKSLKVHSLLILVNATKLVLVNLKQVKTLIQQQQQLYNHHLLKD